MSEVYKKATYKSTQAEDDIIDLFYQYAHGRFMGNGECEVFIDEERELREQLEKILKLAKQTKLGDFKIVH